VFSHETLNLLIIDLDLPDMEGLSLMDALGDRIPTLPVIILTFHNNCEESSDLWPKKIIVEKDGNSVEELKKIIHKMANN
jgi:DNA-binding NarL/FixJ family response regulator